MTRADASATQPGSGDPLDAAFLAFIDRRALMIARDLHSGRVLHFAARPAPEQVQWRPASGRATLFSFTVFRQTYRADMPAPYNVAWVELEEGPRLISTVLVDHPSSLRIGMPLAARFDAQGRLVFIPETAAPMPAPHGATGESL
jgi:hypothetical protein